MENEPTKISWGRIVFYIILGIIMIVFFSKGLTECVHTW